MKGEKVILSSTPNKDFRLEGSLFNRCSVKPTETRPTIDSKTLTPDP